MITIEGRTTNINASGVKCEMSISITIQNAHAP
nr:MAG TPA: hypothetical protein [Microviridae sp.]